VAVEAQGLAASLTVSVLSVTLALMFRRRRSHPVLALQKKVLRGYGPMTPVLREVLALGGRTGSQELMDWASRELNGYGPQDTLPEYRRASAPLALDGMTFNAQVKGQTSAPFSLPDFARGDITNDLHLRMPISQVEHLARTTADSSVVRCLRPAPTTSSST
jgi:hypothetical protein